MKEEESDQKPISFKGAIGIVAGLHILAGIGIFYASTPKSYADDKKFVNTEESKYAGVPDDQVKVSPTPTPTPTPTPEPLKQEVASDGKVITYPRPISSPTPELAKKEIKKVNSKYTQTYTIKKGDTINGIAKRYHLNTNRLIKMNNINDPSKVKEGQVLKFL